MRLIELKRNGDRVQSLTKFLIVHGELIEVLMGSELIEVLMGSELIEVDLMSCRCWHSIFSGHLAGCLCNLQVFFLGQWSLGIFYLIKLTSSNYSITTILRNRWCSVLVAYPVSLWIYINLCTWPAFLVSLADLMSKKLTLILVQSKGHSWNSLSV